MKADLDQNAVNYQLYKNIHLNEAIACAISIINICKTIEARIA